MPLVSETDWRTNALATVKSAGGPTGMANAIITELLNKATCAQLQGDLKKGGQKLSGVKNELINRLAQTKPMASTQQLLYMGNMLKDNNYRHIEIYDILSTHRAAEWLTRNRDV